MIGEGIVIAIAFIAFGFAYLSTELSKNHGALQIAFSIIFVLLSAVDVYLMFSFVDPAKFPSAHGILVQIGIGLMFIFTIVVAYFMIYFLIKAFGLWGVGEE